MLNDELLLLLGFTLTMPATRVRAYIAGLGYYELYYNGLRVGNNVLDPAWTWYPNECVVSLSLSLCFETDAALFIPPL